MIQHIKEYDDEIRYLVENYPVHFTRMIRSVGVHKNKAKDRSYLLDYIIRSTPKLNSDFYTLKTRVYWLLHDMEDFPKCHNPNCPHPELDGFNVKKMKEGYVKFCSPACKYSSDEWKNSIEKGVEKKHGVKNYFMTKEFKELHYELSDEVRAKKYKTHKANHTFNASEKENDAYRLLLQKFDESDILRHHSDERYPFSCDFYIKSIDTFIEYNGTWTHGGHPYDENNEEDLRKVRTWKSKKSQFYENAVVNWTIRDPEKRRVAKETGIRLLEFWNLGEIREYVGYESIRDLSKLDVSWYRKKAEYDFNYYKGKVVKVLPETVSHNNYIIKYFQQDVFFKKEKEIWSNDPEKREKLITNRVKYLGKDESELTPDDILTGFKKSGIYYGYSHFNPLWFKWFIKEYDVKSCYDPCGGWGHRLLGGLDLDLYVYNDSSPSTKKNVDRIVDYFKIKNTVTYNEDASKFNPVEKFEAMFTCPPYFNTEHYECGDFESRDSFDAFLDSLFEVFRKHEECRIFGLAIRDDLLGNHVDYKEKFLINRKEKSYLGDKSNDNEEHIFVFMK